MIMICFGGCDYMTHKLHIHFQTILFNINESSYMVFQQFYPHSLTWKNASDLCKKHGYRLWNMGSNNEWITVTNALDTS